MSEELLVGTVTKFKPAEGYGFAETRLPGSGERITVFFHRGNARIVDAQHYPEFTLTNKSDASVAPRDHGANATKILMRICMGDRGWRARAWGIRPGQNWVYEFLAAKSATQENTLAWFVGGMFTHTTSDMVVIEGMITGIQLTPFFLTVKVDNGIIEDSYRYDLTHARSSFSGKDVIVNIFDESSPDARLRFHR